jgi:processive 1,2-diacylglycerol beta-glucosyltransferase
VCKILIVSVRAGAGHVKAAEAVEAAFGKYHPDVKVVNLDLLDYSTGLIKYLYGKMYLDIVKAFPELYAYTYKHYEPTRKFIKPHFFIDKFNFNEFFAILRDYDPDLVVATHFVPGAVAENYRIKKKKSFRIAVTITDYEFHPLWLVPNVDLYFAATEEVKTSLSYYGIPSQNIRTSGIPIHPKFSEPKDKKELLSKYGFDPSSPILLISAGSFGVTPLGEVISSFEALKEEFQIAVVCGRNDELRKDLENMQNLEPRLKRVFGYVDFMDELMAFSDLFITKPGGITVSESVSRGLPMIFIEPIPGQEEANADYFIEQGAGVKARNLPVLLYKIAHLLKNPKELENMSRKARAISRPFAAKTVAQEAVNFLRGTGPLII